MKNKFIQLHVHSHYSMLDALATPLQIINKTKELGLNSVAITDHGNCNNWGDFYLNAKKNDVKPILGCEFYLIDDLEKWKVEKEKVENNKKLNSKERRKKIKELSNRYHLIILVKNLEGFRNFNLLIYNSYKNFYYRPRIDKKLLMKYSKGLVCSSACIAGEIQQNILNEDENIENNIFFYKELFGKDYYFEFQFNEMEDQKIVNQKFLEYSNKYKIKSIITTDMHYLNKGDQKTHQTLLLMNSKSTYEDLKKKREIGDMNSGAWEFDCKELYYKDYYEVLESIKRFGYDVNKKQFDEMCENTFEIDGKIENYEIDKSIKLKDNNLNIKDKNKYLSELCFKNLKDKKLNENEIYVNRLKYELKIIKEKKLENYFLTVNDIVSNAKKEMLVGCGRGSGCGSLTNYLLSITEIDPIRFNLYFERFLSIERNDVPDIDIDFEDNDKIKKDLMKKYGNDCACISSYSTFQLFNLLKDLCRIYNIEKSSIIDNVNKKIRYELNQIENVNDIAFDFVNGNSKTFQNFIKKYNIIIDDLKILLNKVRHIGKHAAGVIISDNLIYNQPVIFLKNVLQTTLTEGTREKNLSEFGFVKIDILGLNTLKIIHNVLKLIKVKYDLISPNNINLDDRKIYDFVFNKLNVIGIFQFESDGIQKLISSVNPSNFEDIVAINALYRPGPLKSGMSFQYGDRKKSKKNIDYYNSDIIKEVLGVTYGIITYQEQIMGLGNKLGRLSLSDTNVLRKYLDKIKKDKIIDEKLMVLKQKFFKGAKENNVKIEIIKKIWEDMTAFAKYGFNRSHSVAYAMIAYQTAYLKTYYTIEFYCSLLNESVEDQYNKIINEMKKNNIEIRSLDLNNSESDFCIKDNIIYWGFSKVNGIGSKAAEEICNSRDNKKFKSFLDFIIREDINWRLCNKRVVKIMIELELFNFKINNSKLLLDSYLKYNDSKNHLSFKLENWSKLDKKNKMNLIYSKVKEEFDLNKKSYEFDKPERSCFEKQYYKINLKYSVFELNNRKKKIRNLVENKKAGGFDSCCSWFIVEFKNVKRFFDKNGNEMCFLDLQDVNYNVKQGLIFSSNYNKEDVLENNVYCVNGNDDNKFIIERYDNIDNILNKE